MLLGGLCLAPLPARALPRTTETKSLEPIGLQTPGGDGFLSLPSGVKVKEMKSGASDGPSITADSTIFIQVTGRLLNLNGVKFYSTLENDDAKQLGGPEPLVVTLGTKQLIPGLEDGLIGAKKNDIRRIIVPESRGYSSDDLLEPRPTGLGLQALNSVLLNPRRDATLLFDVKVLKIK